MVSEKMTAAINKQINAELYSGYLYFAMSAHCSIRGLSGTANWLFIQGQEEMTHAWRFFNYLNSVGRPVKLQAIDTPPSEWESPLAIFEQVLVHEQKVTSLINDLADLAVSEKDHATGNLLQWFVNEQVEEEENANDILSKLRLAGTQGGGLFMIDKELAARVFVMPLDMVKA